MLHVVTSGMQSQMIPRSEALRLRVSEHPKDIFFARVVGLITLASENLKVFHIIWVYGISTIILDDHVVVPRPSKPHWPSGVLLGRDPCASTSIIEELEIFR